MRKSKLARKLLATAVAALMVGAMSIPVFASSSDPGSSAESLDADLFGSVEDGATKDVETLDSFSLTGTVNVQPIKDKIEELRTQFGDAIANVAGVNSLSSSFTATLTLPAGVIIPDNVAATAEVNGVNNIFNHTVTVNDNVVTVEFYLADADKYKLFMQLYNAIYPNTSIAPELEIIIPGITYPKELVNGGEVKELSFEGAVSGSFSGNGTLGTTTIPFNWTWTGKQSAEGNLSGGTVGDANLLYKFKLTKNPTVTIMNDGATATVAEVRVETGKSIAGDNLTEESMPGALSKAGYKFLGWATAPGATVPNFFGDTTVSEDMTVYPVFEKYPVVTFNVGNEPYMAVMVEKDKSIAGDALTDQSMPENPTMEGYEFLGWSTEMDGTVDFTEDTAVSKDMTVYAVFKKIPVPEKTVDTRTVKAPTPKTDAPKTADDTDAMPFVILGLSSALALGLVSIKRKSAK